MPVGLPRDSTNIWIINTDGTNPVKVTNHKDFIFRNNLHWLDNNKLLYTDGEETVRVYAVNTNSIQTIMGPEEATNSYACDYFYNYPYLIKVLHGKSNESGVTFFILNLDSFKVLEIVKKEDVGIYKGVSFNMENKTISFDGRVTFNQNIEEKGFLIDLETGKMTLGLPAN